MCSYRSKEGHGCRCIIQQMLYILVYIILFFPRDSIHIITKGVSWFDKTKTEP